MISFSGTWVPELKNKQDMLSFKSQTNLRQTSSSFAPLKQLFSSEKVVFEGSKIFMPHQQGLVWGLICAMEIHLLK